MAQDETLAPFILLKAYLILSASSCHWYGLRSKKSLQAVSQNLTSWSLAFSYSGGGYASRLVVSPMAFPKAREKRNSSQVVSSSSSSSSFSSGSPLFLAGLSSRLPFLDRSPSSSLSPPPGAPGVLCCGGGGQFPSFPPPTAITLLSGVGFDCFPFPFTWPSSDSSIPSILASFWSLSSQASL